MENQSISNASDTFSANSTSANQSFTPLVKQTKGNFIVPVLLSVLFVGAVFGLGGYYLGSQKAIDKLSINALPTPNAQKEVASPSTPTPSPIPPAVSEKICTNTSLGLTLTVPSSWICKSEEMSAVDGWINIKSDLFTIDISNLGRGPYCGDGPPAANTDDACRTSNFATTEKVALTLFTSNGEDKEIFGGIVPINKQEQYSKSWISIKYVGMESRKLTASEKTELLDVLNTIDILKK